MRVGARCLVLLTFALAGCSGARTGYDAQRDNPLGPSFWIVPTPSDDDSLLSRTFARPPDTALTLEEQSSPNPCEAKLAAPRRAQMPNHYENAIDTKSSGRGGLLALYGFDAQASGATHLLYKVSTSTKVTRVDTSEYLECCKQQQCGWGYVQSLVFGEGEYAAGAEASASVQGNYSVVSGGAAHAFKVSNTKAIKGYIAAVIVAHDRSQAVQACPAEMVWAKVECVPSNMPVEMERLCRYGKPQASDSFWAGNQSMLEMFRRDQIDACDWLAAHGGPDIPPPPPLPAKPEASAPPL
jgi:hypothetical protein